MTKIVDSPIGMHVLRFLEHGPASVEYLRMCTFPENQDHAAQVFEKFIMLGIIKKNNTEYNGETEYSLTLRGLWIIFLLKRKGTYGKADIC